MYNWLCCLLSTDEPTAF